MPIKEMLLVTPFQKAADNMVDQSQKDWKAGNVGKSWGRSIVAHFIYLADLVASVVILPFALVAMLFGSFHALYKWDSRSEYLQYTTDLFIGKINRIFVSLMGATVTPYGAYNCKNINVIPYGLGILATAALTVLLIKHPPNSFGFDSDGKFKFGWDSYPKHY